MSFLGSSIRTKCWPPVSSDGAFTDSRGQSAPEAASGGGLSCTESPQAETSGWSDEFSDLLISELVFLFLKLAFRQLLSKKMADVDLSSLSSSPDFQASNMKDLLQTLPQVSCYKLPAMHLNRQPSLFQFLRKRSTLSKQCTGDTTSSTNFSNRNCYSHTFI